jgi:trehalose-phosphatase
VAAAVQARAAGRHLLVLTDFDGTLAEIAPTPGSVVLSDEVRHAMACLSRLSSVTFGVISGRRLEDVSSRLGVAAAFVGGLHGLEIVGPDCRFHHPSLDGVESAIVEVREKAARDLAWCPGVHLEDKVYALTCHVRLAPAELAERALEQFGALAEPYVAAGVLKAMVGRKALELLPAVVWHKGRALLWIRERVTDRLGEPVVAMYLGDDRTDQDAFEALDDGDVAIGVGQRPLAEMIDWRLDGPPSVGRLFGRLCDARGGAGR